MMTPLKTFVLAILSVALAATAQAGDFLTDFEAGKKKAAAEKKSLLVKFTGSDWCPPCIQLDKEVFSKKSFSSGVEKDFVVVVLDYPRKKKLPEDQTKVNKEIAKKYGLRSYPTVMLMDSKGKVFKSMSGYAGGGVKPYLAALKSSLKARKFQ
ncbi:MAG: thioredoxin family protein [Akkermansiaceae bacterium]|jgi:thioredoxin-related protein